MFDSGIVLAPAKINLGLRVFPKRADGFHNIESIFTTVPLYDELRISEITEKNTCLVSCSGMQLPLENTITKTYEAFCVLTGVDCGLKVELTKHIPSGGGLGGGSSDSSSFLKSIDTIFATHLTQDQLMALSGRVGSDCFFFTSALASEKKDFAAFVSGRGENVREISYRKDFYVLLLMPELKVSTKEAYGWIDQDIQENGESSESDFVLEEMYKGSLSQWHFVNDFTKSVLRRCPLLASALEDLKKTGPVFADMSGSGSTLFALYESEKKAIQAHKILASDWKTLLV